MSNQLIRHQIDLQNEQVSDVGIWANPEKKTVTLDIVFTDEVGTQFLEMSCEEAEALAALLILAAKTQRNRQHGGQRS